MRSFITIALCFSLTLTACLNDSDNDYQQELAGIAAKIKQLGNPATKDEALKLVYYRYLHATLTGSFDDFKAAEDAIHAALTAYGPVDDLYHLRAQLNFKLHRLQAVSTDISKLPRAANILSLQALRADIDLQQDRYNEALQGYERIIAEKRSWDTLARLAYFRFKTGQPEVADELYREAAGLLSAKEMRYYAWIELQRGLIDLEYERYEEALAHYQIADRAYSGYWLIEEHIAEVLNLLGREREAIALYRKIIDKTHNPEFISALATIFEATDREHAMALHQQAETLYAQRYLLYPEAALGHWITYLLEKSDIDPNLLDYAQRNHEFRPNAESKLLLVKAYLKTGETTQAKELMQAILQTPWRTPEMDTLWQQMISPSE